MHHATKILRNLENSSSAKLVFLPAASPQFIWTSERGLSFRTGLLKAKKNGTGSCKALNSQLHKSSSTQRISKSQALVQKKRS